MRLRAAASAAAVQTCAIAGLLLTQSCPVQPLSQSFIPDHVPGVRLQTSESEFTAQTKAITAEEGVASFIITRTTNGGTDEMKIAVVYPPATEARSGVRPLYPVVLAPGFSAGGCVYLEYVCELAKRGFVVFLPDYKGDFIHFFGLELFRDPLIRPDARDLVKGFAILVEDLAEYTETEVDAAFVLEVLRKFGEGTIKDQVIADMIRRDLFAYRGYCLDAVVRAIFDVAADQDSPLYGRINTDRIGLEAHSLGADEVVQALLRTDDVAQCSWTDNIGVAILKGGTTFLHNEDNMRPITTPLFFMNGEYDDPEGVIAVTWSRFNALDAPAGYITLADSGHMVFVDPPIGFFGDKLVPLFGDFQGIRWNTFVRNRATIVDLSALIYDAYLAQDPVAIDTVRDGAIDFAGSFETRNI